LTSSAILANPVEWKNPIAKLTNGNQYKKVLFLTHKTIFDWNQQSKFEKLSDAFAMI
jgi:hypothetical protein